LFKGRVGEGLRKRKSKSQLVILKKVVYNGSYEVLEDKNKAGSG
jgi:hypothetical protein